MATPLPPQTRTEMLSGSRSPARATTVEARFRIALPALTLWFLATVGAAVARGVRVATACIVNGGCKLCVVEVRDRTLGAK
jgi:hypothetical protein